MDGFQDVILVALAGYQDFPPVSRAPYPSTTGAFDVTVRVSQAKDSYAKIHPDSDGSKVTLPVGTMIVREVLAGDGEVHKLTIMAKGPPGTSPSLGDWWFAVTTAQGIPLLHDGALQIGPMPECQSCHLERASDGYLFGVAASDQL